MAQTNTRMLTAHIPLDMANQIDQLAEKLERPKSWIVKQALPSWIDQEAMTGVDTGNVIHHAEVQA